MSTPKTNTYIFMGDPIPLQRGRYSSSTKKVWDSQKEIKLVTGITLANQHENNPHFSGPLHLDIKFFIQTPKQKKKLNGTLHTARPDLSNLIKFYEDIATSIIFSDDCLIAQITAIKRYDKIARTEMTITEMA